MKILTAEPLESINWVSHGFFTRDGGVSEGIYATLNCAWGSKDEPQRIEANRRKVAGALGLPTESVVTLSQVHSPRVIHVTGAWTREETPEADALVTAKPGLGLAVQTADCAPVLFSSRKSKVVGAAHAGWKGALYGVLEATVEEMKKLGAEPSDIVAAIGPCIGPQSYEVSEGFDALFLKQDAENAKFFRKGARAGHLMFDLPGYIAHRLGRLGLAAVHDTGQDTLPNEADFFSYRRTTLRGEKDYGRQISVIAIR